MNDKQSLVTSRKQLGQRHGKPRIALCHPNFAWGQKNGAAKWNMLPHALCILAAGIRDFCEVEIVDAHVDGMNESEFSRRLTEGNFDMVAISTAMDNFAPATRMAVKLVKSSLPDAIVVAGGIYATMNAAEAMANSEIDYVCIGEGEVLFPELVRHLFMGGERPQRGLAYREDGRVVVQERAPFVEDLDNQPFPAYDMVDYSKYSTWFSRQTINHPLLFPFAEIMTTRGCPNSCCFCQAVLISGRKIRCKSPEKVLGELEYFKDKHGVRSYVFVDDHLIAVRDRAENIFRGMIERGLDLPWKSIAMAVFRLDRELLELMARSGCKYISISIEAGSRRVREDVIGKPKIDLGHAKEMVRIARSLGIFVSANFIIGFPDESWEEIRETFRVAEELQASYISINPAIPLRNTKLWKMCEEGGYFVSGASSETMTKEVGKIVSPNFDAKEVTILRTYEWDRINFSSPERTLAIAETLNMSLDELDQHRRNTRNRALEILANL